MSNFKQYLLSESFTYTYDDINSAKRLTDLPDLTKYLRSKEGIPVLLDDIYDWGVKTKGNPEILSTNTYRGGEEYIESVKYIVDIFDFIEATVEDYLTQYVRVGGPRGKLLKNKEMIDTATKKIIDIIKKDMSYFNTLLEKSMENKIVKIPMPKGRAEKFKIESVLIIRNTKSKHGHALSVIAERD